MFDPDCGHARDTQAIEGADASTTALKGSTADEQFFDQAEKKAA